MKRSTLLSACGLLMAWDAMANKAVFTRQEPTTLAATVTTSATVTTTTTTTTTLNFNCACCDYYQPYRQSNSSSLTRKLREDCLDIILNGDCFDKYTNRKFNYISYDSDGASQCEIKTATERNCEWDESECPSGITETSTPTTTHFASGSGDRPATENL